MKRVPLLVLAMFCALLSCSQKANKAQPQDVRTVAEKSLGKNISLSSNESKHYTLAFQNRSAQDHINREFRFVVIDNNSRSIIKEGTFVQGYVKWATDNELELLTKEKNASESSIHKINLKQSN